MSQAPIRVLHLSDFHFGKDPYGQTVLFEQVLAHIHERFEAHLGPDLIFITGDIAQSGKQKQYEVFRDSFLARLMEMVPANRVYLVPGNHDVDRTKTKEAPCYDLLESSPHFFDPTPEGFNERKALFPRFRAFVECLDHLTPTGWLLTQEGTFAKKMSIHGTDIGILLLNTAWLSGGEYEKLRLRLGKEMAQAALKRLGEVSIVFALGHHPLNWMHEDDAEKLRGLFSKFQVIYLSGHVHKGKGRLEFGAGSSFLALGAGAGFQARESEIWRNGFQWYELDLNAGKCLVEPLTWNAIDDEWRLDTYCFPNKLRVPQKDQWAFEVNSRFKKDPGVESSLSIENGGLDIENGDLTIEKATYGSSSQWTDLTDPLRDSISMNQLKFPVGNIFGGDPASRQKKELRVHYFWKGVKREMIVQEGDTLILPPKISDVASQSTDATFRENGDLKKNVNQITPRSTHAEKTPIQELETSGKCLFISYIEEDEAWFEKILTFLKPLERQGFFLWGKQIYHTANIEEIMNAIEKAQVVVLLVSQSYLSSDLILDFILPSIFDKSQTRKINLHWIPLSASLYEKTVVNKYIPAWSPEKPLNSMSPAEVDDALVKISKNIMKTVE